MCQVDSGNNGVRLVCVISCQVFVISLSAQIVTGPDGSDLQVQHLRSVNSRSKADIWF